MTEKGRNQMIAALFFVQTSAMQAAASTVR